MLSIRKEIPEHFWGHYRLGQSKHKEQPGLVGASGHQQQKNCCYEKTAVFHFSPLNEILRTSVNAGIKYREYFSKEVLRSLFEQACFSGTEIYRFHLFDHYKS